MSANDPITLQGQTISKWPFSSYFKFEYFCDIYVTQKQSKIARPWLGYRTKCEISHKDNPWQISQK